MTRQTQKEQERHYVEELLHRIDERRAIENGSEPPDFFVWFNEHVVGVEVTEFHSPLQTSQGKSRRDVESAWENIRRIAGEIQLANADLKHLHVQLRFKNLDVPSKSQAKQFVTSILEFLQNHSSNIGSSEVVYKSHETTSTMVEEYVECITVNHIGCFMNWDWNYDYAGVGTNDEEMLEVIGKKLTVSRPTGLFEYWLLVVGGSRLSSFLEPISVDELSSYEKLNASILQSPFDKIFVLGEELFWWERETGWCFQERA